MKTKASRTLRFHNFEYKCFFLNIVNKLKQGTILVFPGQRSFHLNCITDCCFSIIKHTKIILQGHDIMKKIHVVLFIIPLNSIHSSSIFKKERSHEISLFSKARIIESQGKYIFISCCLSLVHKILISLHALNCTYKMSNCISSRAINNRH